MVRRWWVVGSGQRVAEMGSGVAEWRRRTGDRRGRTLASEDDNIVWLRCCASRSFFFDHSSTSFAWLQRFP